ncbi:Ger(x)C family spore germination protein [Bacillus dakarensis]|uniref:Ger(x)C family spore germination protein n=1 Tax=Robertmurraya dakarensis TaxID=1926278 RepID=UPI000981179E|nr:Ger(x)C family spore germination protein [Bacillus dakarensis]
MEKRKICNALILLLIALALTGCWDKKEVEQKAYVIGLGLDKSEDKGPINVTLLIANPEVGSQQTGGAQNEPVQEIITLPANDFISVKNTANVVVARELSYDLMEIIIVSEEFAKEKEFIRWMYDAAKEREIRRDIFLAVSKEKASEFIKKNKPKVETRPHKYFQFMIRQGIQTGLIPKSDLHRFFKVTEQDADLFLAMYISSKKDESTTFGNVDQYLPGELDISGSSNQTQFIGSAVFKEGIMIGKLNGQETRIAQTFDNTSNISNVMVTYPDPFDEDYKIAIRLIKKHPVDVKMSLQNGRLNINMEVPFTVEVLTDPSMANYATDSEKVKILKEHLQSTLEKSALNFIKKTQEELKGNPFSLSLHGRRLFSTIPEYEDFDWMKSYPEADINVKVKMELGEFGKQTKVIDLEKVRD